MPFDLPLPKKLRVRGWKVKIREKERLEPPHVTVFHGEDIWRIGLRNRDFLVPPGGSWNDIDVEVRELIEDEDNWKELCEFWDGKYPNNPVTSKKEDENV